MNRNPFLKGGPGIHLITDNGTVSIGPSYQSQGEVVGGFLDTLIQNLPNSPIPPQAAAKLLARSRSK
jgi:hypothetical protein